MNGLNSRVEMAEHRICNLKTNQQNLSNLNNKKYIKIRENYKRLGGPGDIINKKAYFQIICIPGKEETVSMSKRIIKT